MSIADGYASVKPSIVAVCAKGSDEILGTGFVVDENGVILTNRHVIDAIFHLKTDKDVWPAYIRFFSYGQDGVQTAAFDVRAVGAIASGGGGTGGVPDIGIIRVGVSGLPALHVCATNVREGDEVLVAGFSMGSSLGLPSPVLKVCHVAALVSSASGMPRSILIHGMLQEGGSGSPVFTPEGILAGMAYAAVEDRYFAQGMDGGDRIIGYGVPSDLSRAIPSGMLQQVIARYHADPDVQSHDIPTAPLSDQLFR